MCNLLLFFFRHVDASVERLYSLICLFISADIKERFTNYILLLVVCVRNLEQFAWKPGKRPTFLSVRNVHWECLLLFYSKVPILSKRNTQSWKSATDNSPRLVTRPPASCWFLPLRAPHGRLLSVPFLELKTRRRHSSTSHDTCQLPPLPHAGSGRSSQNSVSLSNPPGDSNVNKKHTKKDFAGATVSLVCR